MAYVERQRKQKSQRRVFKSLNQRPSIIQITSELQWQRVWFFKFHGWFLDL